MIVNRTFLDVLDRRDLLEPAKRIALGFGLTVEELFARGAGARELPRPRARGAFFAHLRGLGWSDAAIARLVSMERKTVSQAIETHESALRRRAEDDSRAARVGEVLP
ncbi:MAG TPA: hypothetical protein VIY73_21390 [Polyangiaceae bacterium]